MKPTYIIEEEKLRRNLEIISGVAKAADVEIILAFKAFALWKTFPIFREYISHTTASSLFEARLAFEEFGSKPHTYSPAYTQDEFPEIARMSSHVSFNSLTQFERFHDEALRQGAECGLRVNPEYSEVETELYNPCAPGTRFGVLCDELVEKGLPEGVTGFHCHTLCESDPYEFERVLRHIEEKFGRWMPDLKWMNFGGGHLMTREDYDRGHLVEVLKAFKSRHPNLRVILEPGSAFAWQTGPLVSEVVDIVENHGIRTAVLNVSFTCHMPDCLEMPYQPAVRGAVTLPSEYVKTAPHSEHVYRLGGNSCLSGDYMGCWKFDHELELGERVIFEDMIHYTTVKTNMFNGIGHPSLAIRRMDGSVELLREFGYEDYRDRMD